MSLCWSSNNNEPNLSMKLNVLLVFDEFLFEDIPRYARLLSIWAFIGAGWLLWLDHLFRTGRRW